MRKMIIYQVVKLDQTTYVICNESGHPEFPFPYLDYVTLLTHPGWDGPGPHSGFALANSHPDCYFRQGAA